VVAPGADPGQIRLSFEGVDGMRIDGEGNLVLAVAGGEIVQQAPRVLQRADGKEWTVAGRYVMLNEAGAKAAEVDETAGCGGLLAIGFQLTSYDVTQPLVIDPVVVYSTYLGGSDNNDDGEGIAVDGAGNAYITGRTLSADFPVVSAVYSNNAGGFDAYATKLDAQGLGPVYSTYLGGSLGDHGSGIAVDGAGNAYITGTTESTDFPTINARYPVLRGGQDAFVTMLDPKGQGPVYSTYLGGSGPDEGNGIAVDGAGNTYVTGETQSADFPAVNGRYPDHGRFEDAFVTKLDPRGQGPVYSTFLGGRSSDRGFGIAVDGSGNVYVTGHTGSTDFPRINAAYPNSTGLDDAFVTKFDAQGQGPVYSTYLGGSLRDYGYGIAADGAGNAYVTGQTESADFPKVNALYQSYGGYFDAFVTKFNATGQPVYSTYLGGSSSDNGNGIAVDGAGNAYVTGFTYSINFPTVNPVYFRRDFSDAFVTKLDPSGQGPVYSTYLSGSFHDQALGIAVDVAGNAYVTGWSGTDFPVVNARYSDLLGIQDAFVTKIADTWPPTGSGAFIGVEVLDAKDFRSGSAISTDPITLSNQRLGRPMRGVATDGIAQLVLRARTNHPGIVTFAISDPDGGPTGNAVEYGQLWSPPGGDRGATLPVQTESVGSAPGEFFAFARYRAPETFPRSGVAADLGAAQRSLRLRVSFQPSDGTPPPAQPLDRNLTLARPPVVLIHGLASSSETWNTFETKLRERIPGLYLDAEVGDYRDNNLAHFSVNGAVPTAAVIRARNAYRDRGLAAIQADVFGHSMGGVLSRIAAGGNQYRRDRNYGEGDFNKLVTVDSPHHGSPWADLLWASLSLPVGKGIETVLGVPSAQYLGAIEDLQTASG